MKTNLSTLQNQLKQFTLDRGWERFHTPRNLAMAINVEAGELMQLFLWDNQFSNPLYFDEVADELADIMIYCLSLFNAIQRDAAMAIQDKITRNMDRFPVAA